ncbi:MAG: sigma-54-dependent Fis family transcriptional regulator [Bacillota bacterium]
MGQGFAEYKLNEIYETLVSVCNAVASVINVDVTIVDASLNRITGTGKYVMSIGKQLSKNCVFAYALETGERLFIENPRLHTACNRCENKNECKEFAQVCCPIKIEGRVAGIIGLIAFNESQKATIIGQKNSMLEFLDNMSELIASKIADNIKTRKVGLMAQELETLVNYMDMGVISTDESGNILRYNTIAKQMFGLDAAKPQKENISELMDELSLVFTEEKQSIYNKEFSYKSRNCRHRGIYNVKPMVIGDRTTGFIFTFNRMNEVIKAVNDLAGTDMVVTFDEILGESSGLRDVKEYAAKIAASASTVLIQGESGTGKELFARAVHHASERRAYPFVAINCTAIPENLMESELFGYEEGAFTGARKGGKLGKFELANKGTIFLDEIGDMPLNLQAKLLRVLQENKIERVGGNSVIPVNVRIIAASNKLLEQKVKEKEFREDLYYRLNVIPLYLPPLRERLEDIEILSYSFLEKYNIKLGRNIKKLDMDVIAVFKSYPWPGNVRELENTIEYSVNMCTNTIIKKADLPRRFKELAFTEFEADNAAVVPLAELEKIEMIKAVKLFGNNSEGIMKAAAALGISRATMYRKLKEYGVK